MKFNSIKKWAEVKGFEFKEDDLFRDKFVIVAGDIKFRVGWEKASKIGLSTLKAGIRLDVNKGDGFKISRYRYATQKEVIDQIELILEGMA